MFPLASKTRSRQVPSDDLPITNNNDDVPSHQGGEYEVEVAPVLEVPRAEGGTELSICEQPLCGRLRDGALSCPGQFAQPVDGSLPKFLDWYSISYRMTVLTLFLPRGYFTRRDVKGNHSLSLCILVRSSPFVVPPVVRQHQGRERTRWLEIAS